MENYDFSDFGSEEDLGGSECPKPGQYHLVVTEADESREKISKGILFKLQVLAGNVKKQAGKTASVILNDPSPDHSDGGRFATQIVAKLAIALGLMPPDGFGNANAGIDWSQAVGRQFVATLIEDVKDNGRIYANIDGLKMYRIDDPEVADVPKDEASLALIGGGAAAVAGAPTQAPFVNPPTQPQASPSAVPAAAPADDDKWKNL